MSLMDAIHENRLLSRWATLLPASPARRGTVHQADAELVDLGDGRLLALTVDAVVEEVRAGLYRDPRTVGRIAATASLSDLAAVGADPLGLLVSATLPAHDPEGAQVAVAAGLADACAAAGTFVLGGDTSEGPALEVAVTAAGLVPTDAVLTRVGAGPGDELWISGPVGAGAALAAAVVLGLPGMDEGAFRPPPRLREGRALRGIATACIDTSDGLVAALDQLARLNGVAAHVTRDLPELLEPVAEALRRRSGLPAFPFVASHHGEFELLFTVPPAFRARLEARAASIGWAPLRIGAMEAGVGLVLGDRPVDGAAVRNLLHNCGGDPRTYAARLIALGGTP